MLWCEQGPTNVDAIGVMVELGAKVSAVMEHCTLETPLHIAARCGRQDVLRKLLRCGLPVLARTKVCSPFNIFFPSASLCRHLAHVAIRMEVTHCCCGLRLYAGPQWELCGVGWEHAVALCCGIWAVVCG